MNQKQAEIAPERLIRNDKPPPLTPDPVCTKGVQVLDPPDESKHERKCRQKHRLQMVLSLSLFLAASPGLSGTCLSFCFSECLSPSVSLSDCDASVLLSVPSWVSLALWLCFSSSVD